MNTFGERFKSIRLSKNLTQEQLVAEINEQYGYAFTKTTISQYENNKRIPEMNAIRSFAEYFNVSLDYLLCNDIYVIKELAQRDYMYDDSQFIERPRPHSRGFSHELGRFAYVNLYLEVKVMAQVYYGRGYVYSIE